MNGMEQLVTKSAKARAGISSPTTDISKSFPRELETTDGWQGSDSVQFVTFVDAENARNLLRKRPNASIRH
jgi:hypothetical protein